MCMGKEKLEFYMAEIRKKGDAASKKEQDTLKDMRIVQEMYARGYDFMPIDIYRAKAHRFQIIEGKLMPSIDSIEGLGDREDFFPRMISVTGPRSAKLSLI